MMGFNTNIELHEYMRGLLGLETSMITLTDKYFAPHDKVFKGMKMTIKGKKPEEKQLIVKHKGKTMTISAFSSDVQINKKKFRTKTPAVYVDKKDLFYVDSSLSDELTD